MTLKDFQNDLAKSVYGMTKEDAILRGICIDCKHEVLEDTGNDEAFFNNRVRTQAGQREYFISGLCEDCFDKLTREN